MALRRLLQGSVLPPPTGRAAATEQFSTASGGTITATLFPGDGIGPEIAESVKQSVTKNVSLGTEAFWFGQQRKSGVGFVGRYGTKKMGFHYARLSSPFSSIPQVDRAVGNLERSSEFDALKATRTRSAISKTRGEAMMFPLHFHYENVLRQDLLLKLNHDNVMQVPGLFEIRLVPKAASDLKIQIGKLAMEILCGQRFIQTQKGPSSKAGKSNPFLAAEKDAASAFARQSVLRGHGMYHFLVRLLTAASMLDSPVKIQENSIKMSMEMEFCEFSPELEDHFEIFENIRGFNVTIVTSANTKDETLLLWSGILQKDEGGN